MDITAASTERTIHIRICHHLWIRAFNMYIFKIPGFYECPISWVHFSLKFREICFNKIQKLLKQIKIAYQIYNNCKILGDKTGA